MHLSSTFAGPISLLGLHYHPASHRIAACSVRCYHTAKSTFREWTEHVPVGGSGNITLRFAHLFLLNTFVYLHKLRFLSSSSIRIVEPIEPAAKSPSRVLLYLPPGPPFKPVPPNDALPPVLTSHRHGRDVARTLASASLATIVTINYRLGQVRHKDGKSATFKFPTPIHDTLAGFDWVYQNLNPTHVGVFGRHIGGSLALMLALTEPQSVAAVVAESPICDWVGLEDYCKVETKKDGERQKMNTTAVSEMSASDESEHKLHHRRKRSKLVPEDLPPLITARKRLFHSPQNYFDPFASPALFLRTTGKYCPSKFPAVFTGPKYPVPVIVPAKERNPWLLAASMLKEEKLDAELDDATKHLVRRRRVLSRWPPVGLDYGTHAFSGSSYKGYTRDPIALPNVKIFLKSSVPPEDARLAGQPSHVEEVDALNSQLENIKMTSEEQEIYPQFGKSQPTSERKTRQITPRGSLPDTSKSREETVLATQGAEMVELLRSACFWGQSKGTAESRVTLVRVASENVLLSTEALNHNRRKDVEEKEGGKDSHAHQDEHSRGALNPCEGLPIVTVEEQAGAWFQDLFAQKYQKQGELN